MIPPGLPLEEFGLHVQRHIAISAAIAGQHTIGRFRLSATTSPQPRAGAPQLPANIAALLAIAADKRTAAQNDELKNYYLSLDAEYQRIRNTVNEYVALAPRARLVGVQDLAWAMINSPAFLFNR